MAKQGAWRARMGALAWWAAAGAGVAACAAVGPLGEGTASTGAGSTGAVDGGGGSAPEATGGSDASIVLDGSSNCGDQVQQVVTDAPNLYFIFDVSGSMADPGGGGFTKYEIVEHSAVTTIETLGPLINVGAAVFPSDAQVDACHAGAEVFPVSPGDPISPSTGPTTGGFIAATSVTPLGGTPTAATLTALQPNLLKLPGRTVVILSTDGGPNCNGTLSCGADQCIPNLEGQCPGSTNCCAPGTAGGPEACLDHDASVAAVAALAAAKIPVFVVGVPGSDLYASVLDDMAVAGGEPQAAPPYYYAVDDLTKLTQLFQTIAGGFVSCDYTLQDPPPDEDHTNVYFDGTVVLEDPNNGWIWKSPSEIELVGAACQSLKAGMVKQVQIVSGCPTQKST